MPNDWKPGPDGSRRGLVIGAAAMVATLVLIVAGLKGCRLPDDWTRPQPPASPGSRR